MFCSQRLRILNNIIMKRKLVLFTAFVALVGIFTVQAQDIHNRPCIDVSGKAEMFVEPDEIILSIVINEKDYSKKTTLEKLEKEMIKSLKNMGIDTKKNLTVVDLSSDINHYKIKKDEIKLSKTYRLKTSSAKEATTALLVLEEVGISEINIAQIKCTKIEEYKDEARVIAMKDAHRKAKLLTEAINQPLGKAIYITENDFTNVRTYPRLMMSKSNGVMEDAVAESAVADISFEKIKIESRVQIKFALE